MDIHTLTDTYINMTNGMIEVVTRQKNRGLYNLKILQIKFKTTIRFEHFFYCLQICNNFYGFSVCQQKYHIRITKDF